MIEQKMEALSLRFRNRILLPCFSKYRLKKLVNKDMTIISNNCWAGTIYESYGLKKLSPIVGMFIMPEDYLRILGNLDYYFSIKPVFIDINESKWKDLLSKKDNWGTYPIARLNDVELHMLHYHNHEEALQKWDRRVERVNRENLLVKFNDQNDCTLRHIEQFVSLPYQNKICFVSRKEFVIDSSVIYIPQFSAKGRGIKASREPYGQNRYCNVTMLLNGMKQ